MDPVAWLAEARSFRDGLTIEPLTERELREARQRPSVIVADVNLVASPIGLWAGAGRGGARVAAGSAVGRPAALAQRVSSVLRRSCANVTSVSRVHGGRMGLRTSYLPARSSRFRGSGCSTLSLPPPARRTIVSTSRLLENSGCRWSLPTVSCCAHFLIEQSARRISSPARHNKRLLRPGLTGFGSAVESRNGGAAGPAAEPQVRYTAASELAVGPGRGLNRAAGCPLRYLLQSPSCCP